MPWQCLQCRELIDDAHEVCWHCGTGRDGTVDPEFQHADEFEPPLPSPERPQFRLATLLKLVTALSFVFGMFSVIAAGRQTLWSGVVCLAGLASLKLLVGVVFASVLTTGVHNAQREIRESARSSRDKRP
jgi:hypothetical protein